jgi:hypothetical protein
MEDTEPHHAEQRENQHGIYYLEEISQQDISFVEYPENTGSTGHYNGTVNEKNTPIRQ